MALKADRQVDAYEVGYFLNETASQGVIVSANTAGSGIALEDTANLATVAANSSGAKPIGMLLTEVVNIDLTRQAINWNKDQVNIGGKVAIMTKGWAVTDKITGTPTVGQKAVLSSSGTVTGQANQSTGWHNELINPYVGTFRSVKNEDGFARVYVDL